MSEPATEKTEILAEAERQLREYFAGVRKIFDLPLKPDGTAFFQSVWSELQEIPYGETRTYGDIAKAVGQTDSGKGGRHGKSSQSDYDRDSVPPGDWSERKTGRLCRRPGCEAKID